MKVVRGSRTINTRRGKRNFWMRFLGGLENFVYDFLHRLVNTLGKETSGESLIMPITTFILIPYFHFNPY